MPKREAPERELYVRLRVVDVYKEYPSIHVMERSYEPLTANDSEEVVVSLPYRGTRAGLGQSTAQPRAVRPPVAARKAPRSRARQGNRDKC